MPKTKCLFSINTVPDGTVVNIHADADGLELLAAEIRRLQRGLEANECEHGHFISEAWGGDGLSESMVDAEEFENNRQVHHLKLYAWTPASRSRHGL